jgi:prepilin-type N-terminal cleavage/methylation domain-containing protein
MKKHILRCYKGFTLIELLIVVAIIAILAAIAVPNFLEAQTRAKVARERADMRSVATALETYKLDTNKYPADGQADSANWKYAGTNLSYWSPAHINNMITTPIAYLSTTIYDSFAPKNASNIAFRTLRYVNYRGTYMEYRPSPVPSVYATYQSFGGEYQITSMGPDQTASVTDPAYNVYWIVSAYDATNGTVSQGDIIRTQKNPEGYTYHKM